jgi:hypothetical protein
LVDRQATRRAIMDELQALEGRSQPGDHLFLYFSGHGTSPYDPNRLPLPHSTGAFLPYDFPSGEGVSPHAQVENLRACLESAPLLNNISNLK